MANEDRILELLVDIKGSVDNLDKRLTDVDKRLTEVARVQNEIVLPQLNKLTERVDEMDKRLTERIDEVDKRLTEKIDKVDKRLTEKIDEVDKRLTEEIRDVNNRLVQVAIIQENEVLPKIELLLEGQTTMMDTFAPKARVEALEEEIIYIKSDIAMLKKAE